MRYVNESDIRALGVDWTRTVDAVERAAHCLVTGDFAQPIKPYLRYREMENRIIAMPAFLGGDVNIAGIKWIASFPRNIDRGIPRAHSTVILNEAETGRPVAIVNTALLSVVRTASVTGIVLRSYVRARNPQRVQLGIAGWGPIGRYHLEMARAVLGRRLSSVRIFDIRPTVRTIAPDIDMAGIDVSFVSSWQEAYDEADVFITCTVSPAPYIDRRPKAGSLQLNISLRDYCVSFHEFVKGAIVVDDWDEVCRERTDIEMMYLECGLRREGTTSIGDFVTSDYWQTISDDAPVMFNPMGMAVFDLAIGAEYVALAEQRGVGTLLD